MSEVGADADDPRLVNVRHFPELAAANRNHDRAVHELSQIRCTTNQSIFAPSRSFFLRPLSLSGAPNENCAALAPVRMGKGFR